MQHYRVTIRHGGARHRCAVLDVRVAGVREALRAAADSYPLEAADGDLFELRRLTAPDERMYIPE